MSNRASGLTARWVAPALLSIITCAGGLTLATGLTSGVASAVTPSTMTLNGTAAVTVDGSSWDLVAEWQQLSTSSPPDLVIGLDRSVTTGGAGYEEHTWTVPVTASTLAFNAGTGVGTLNTGTQTSPLATVDLTFNATSHASGTCATGSETIYNGTLSGNLTLVTGLAHGGTVGGTAVAFTAATPTITVDSDCVPTSESGCSAGVFFSSGDSTSAPAAFGFSESEADKSVGSVGVQSETSLSSPAGTTRDDAGALISAAPPKYSAKTKTLSVTSSASGLVTGSATLTGAKPKSNKIPCSVGAKKYTLTDTFDLTAAYASPAGKALVADLELGNSLTAPTSTKTGSYEVETLKAA